MSEELTTDEISVIMQMSGDLAYTAAYIAADLSHEQPGVGWTAKKVNAAHKTLRAKGYADFGTVWDDEGQLRGRGYWLSSKGCTIRYRSAAA